jgi:undecaprenyl-diphosphatase
MLAELDTRLFLALNATFSHGGWLVLMSVLTAVGSGWAGLVVLPLFVSPRSRRFAAFFAGALAATATTVFLLKALIHRRRPYLAIAGVRALVFEAPTDFSCPSGHAAGSFAFVTFLVVVLMHSRVAGSRARRLGLAALLYVVALLVCLSRIALGVHDPGDVAFGAALGAMFGALAAKLYLREIPAL